MTSHTTKYSIHPPQSIKYTFCLQMDKVVVKTSAVISSSQINTLSNLTVLSGGHLTISDTSVRFASPRAIVLEGNSTLLLKNSTFDHPKGLPIVSLLSYDQVCVYNYFISCNIAADLHAIVRTIETMKELS